MLNCIAQLSDLQSLLLAPTLPFPSLTTAGNVDGSAPPTHLLYLPLESKRLLESLNLARLGLRPQARGQCSSNPTFCLTHTSGTLTSIPNNHQVVPCSPGNQHYL